MNVQKIDELKQALADGVVQSMEHFIETHNDLKGKLFETMKAMEAFYDPLTNVYNPWCESNLTDTEKNYVKTRYAGMKTLYNSMV